MPNLWKFISKAGSDAPKVEAYQFSAAEDLDDAVEEPAPLTEEPEAEQAPEPAVEEPSSADPIRYAQVHSDRLLQEARRQADQILREAEEEARRLAQEAREKAEEEGYHAGFHEGIQQGTAKAIEEGVQAREALAARLEEDVAAFIERAERTLNRQLGDNMDDLRDLALAVAEKIICVSLKSSTDVIGRMVQTAVDKRKRCEWAHIYIAECDAKRLTSVPASLSAALAELSDRVRIIPMADDEAGTCIIECPDEIIDASAATQMRNIRTMLSDHSSGGVMTNFNFTEY